MIYFEGLDTVIESIYLDDELGNKIGECSVFINPDNTKYLIGKTVIINSPIYPEAKIYELLENGNKVISRLECSIENVIFQPYILRISEKIQYSGKEVYDAEFNSKEILQNYCTIDPDTGTLYFPKLYNLPQYLLHDTSGNLTGLGWACQEVGINIKEDTVFKNMDILKLKKLILW